MNMHITVTATEANRSFSRLLREVGKGKRVTVTAHGRPIATLAPVEDEGAEGARRQAALEKLQKRWATQEHVTTGPWTRDELYERD